MRVGPQQEAQVRAVDRAVGVDVAASEVARPPVGVDSSRFKPCPSGGCRFDGYCGSVFIRGTVGFYVGARSSFSFTAEEFLSTGWANLADVENLTASGGFATGVWGASIERGVGLQIKACCKSGEIDDDIVAQRIRVVRRRPATLVRASGPSGRY